MPSIDWYLDEARARTGTPSDNALSRRLGMANQAVNQWRTKKAWPHDDAMVALAELAGVDPAKALLDLNIWRVKSERARDKYLALLAKISAAGIVAFCSTMTVARAGTQVEQVSANVPSNIHYAIFIISLILRFQALEPWSFGICDTATRSPR